MLQKLLFGHLYENNIICWLSKHETSPKTPKVIISTSSLEQVSMGKSKTLQLVSILLDISPLPILGTPFIHIKPPLKVYGS